MASILAAARRKKLGPLLFHSHSYVVSLRARLSNLKTINRLQVSKLTGDLLSRRSTAKQNGHAAHRRQGRA